MAADLNMVFDYFPRLKERRNQLAGTLSGGEQQMLAMGRALMSHPNTILMDEPSMGLSPKLVKEIFAIIRKLHDEGITVHMCSKPGASPWKAMHRICCMTSRYARPILVRNVLPYNSEVDKAMREVS